MTHHMVTPTIRLVAAGAAVVGISFGLARYGYGLLLPDLRATLDLSSATLGVIGSGSIAAYLLATVAAGALAARAGARSLVVAGGALAVAGMAIVAAAESAIVLGTGILVAGAASGLVFPPFADAVQQRLAPRAQARGMAIISSGTGWGVLVSVPIALAVGADWRLAWIAYAALALIATLWAARALGGGRVDAAEVEPGWRR
jgi:predicted MFS family arabinose efflux permease